MSSSKVSRARRTNSKARSVSGSVASLDPEAGESVRVVVRVRPMSERELQNGENSCIQVPSSTQVNLMVKG
jgi:hypothetical protein